MPLPSRGSKEDLGLRDRLGFADREEDADFVASWIGRLILYSVGPTGRHYQPVPMLMTLLSQESMIGERGLRICKNSYNDETMLSSVDRLPHLKFHLTRLILGFLQGLPDVQV